MNRYAMCEFRCCSLLSASDQRSKQAMPMREILAMMNAAREKIRSSAETGAAVHKYDLPLDEFGLERGQPAH
jgi:hypothetical protein